MTKRDIEDLSFAKGAIHRAMKELEEAMSVADAIDSTVGDAIEKAHTACAKAKQKIINTLR